MDVNTDGPTPDDGTAVDLAASPSLLGISVELRP